MLRAIVISRRVLRSKSSGEPEDLTRSNEREIALPTNLPATTSGSTYSLRSVSMGEGGAEEGEEGW